MLSAAIDKVFKHYHDIYFDLPKSKPLPEDLLAMYEQEIEKDRHKIWDKSFWGLSVHESICAIACPLDGKIKSIDRYKSLKKIDLTVK